MPPDLGSVYPRRPLVFLGHPGHELRIYGWLKAHAPEVWVMTDGSGSAGTPRTELSRGLLKELGATPGKVFGAFRDTEIYAAILRSDLALFTGLAEALAERLVLEECDALVTDSAEGYNPCHDLCHLIGAAAAARAGRKSQRAVRHFDFPLTGDPRGPGGAPQPGDLWLTLSEEAAEAKVEAATRYATLAGGPLLQDVQAARAKLGLAVFQHERIMPVAATDYCDRFVTGIPEYERNGEERVHSGTYQAVIRLEAHMAPLASRLAAWQTN